ncbi:hypothetical protein I308_106715 [Cryptococcus tetragattii IND107]|uniref:Zn(2)-C6 fungal-type domain-containing protein n=1 Tax=Cryptococcus tetragattii IND107 TaxID=1296105 RepID=A0ABR3BID4_9TREE
MAVRSDQQASAEMQTGNGHENVGMRLPHTPGQQHLESVPIAATSRAPASSSSIKIAACLACRAIKGKCETPDGVGPCVRCARRRQQCERPIIHRSGRPKGSKNRHSSLERAFKVIERGVHQSPAQSRKRPRLDRDGHDNSEGSHIYDQSGLAQSPITQPATSPQQPPYRRRPESSFCPAPFDFPALDAVEPQRPSSSTASLSITPYTNQQQPVIPMSARSYDSHQSSHPGGEMTREHDDGLSNPVRLLAEAAEEIGASEQSGHFSERTIQAATTQEPILPPEYNLPETLYAMLTDGEMDPISNTSGLSPEYLAQGLEILLSDGARRKLSDEDRVFFNPPLKEVKRDIGDEYCPLALALLTPREVKAFFATFYLKLHPMLPVLDPVVHTPEFVQSRSAFLFTAICAHGASLTAGAEEATKRLRIHTQRLADQISPRGFISVEIVKAFLIWISWLPSSVPFQEERLWHETKYAINMGLELELSKPLPSDLRDLRKDPSWTACLEGISMDDWDVVERIIRSRQRLWIHLFLWDSSLNLAFGKATRFTQDHLIRDETWCFHRLATKGDAVTTACVNLRRLSVRLSDMLRLELHIRANMTSEWVAERIDEVLNPWRAFWSQHCDGSAYLELVFRHTRLWTLSYALQALTWRSGSVEALTKDTFSAALHSCELVCEQLRASRGLWGFPNTMGPMLSFEALLAIRLLPQDAGTTLAFRARLFGVLSQLSLLLEQVGTTPSHRLGTAAVYGRHLQVYIRRRVIDLCVNHHQYETGQLHGDGSDHTAASSGSQAPLMREAEASINQLFSSDWISPTDQAQANMTLDGINTLNFFDTTAGWTDDFFRLFGKEQ